MGGSIRKSSNKGWGIKNEALMREGKGSGRGRGGWDGLSAALNGQQDGVDGR